MLLNRSSLSIDVFFFKTLKHAASIKLSFFGGAEALDASVCAATENMSITPSSTDASLFSVYVVLSTSLPNFFELSLAMIVVISESVKSVSRSISSIVFAPFDNARRTTENIDLTRFGRK